MITKIKLQNFDKWNKAYKEAPERFVYEVQQSMFRGGDIVVENVIDRIKKKGLVFQGKMTQQVKKIVSRFKFEVIVDVQYARTLEDGASTVKVSAKALKRWARFKLGNENKAFLVARKLRREGTKGRHYFEEGVNKSIPELEKIFGEIFDKLFKNIN